MKEIIKTSAILIALLALGLAAGNGVQRLIAKYHGQDGAPRAGDYSALIQLGQAPVVLFGTSTCPYCKQARAYLDAHAIPYRDINVEKTEGAALFHEYGGSAVPLLLTSTMRLQGFVQPEYDRHVLPLTKRG